MRFVVSFCAVAPAAGWSTRPTIRLAAKLRCAMSSAEVKSNSRRRRRRRLTPTSTDDNNTQHPRRCHTPLPFPHTHSHRVHVSSVHPPHPHQLSQSHTPTVSVTSPHTVTPTRGCVRAGFTLSSFSIYFSMLSSSCILVLSPPTQPTLSN